VEDPVTQRLARLEPGQRFEQLELVVLLGPPGRGVAELNLSAVGADDPERDFLALDQSPFVRSFLKHRSTSSSAVAAS
jgi:hypothetical protein